MFKWEKLGLLFQPQKIKDRDWLKEYAQAPSVVVFDDYVRVYFSCRPLPDEKGQYVSYSAYVDLNKDNLFEIIKVADKPILELGEVGTFDEFGTYPVSVIKDNNKYIAYYGGWTRCESIPFTVAIGMATSIDNGVTFKKAGSGPIISPSVKEPFVLSGPKIRKFNNKWYLWYVAVTEWLENNGKPEATYKIRMAESDDGLNWNRNAVDIITNSLGEDECHASPDVIYKNGRYHMFFCYKYSINFRNNKRGYRIGYAYSDDLKTWTRDDSNVGIDISQEGWDDQDISYPTVFELNNQIYMFYIGNTFGKYGFGLAKLKGTL